MSLLRRSLTVAAVLAVASAGLGLNASAEDASGVQAPAAAVSPERGEPRLAVGVLVKTTTPSAGAGLVETAESVLPDGIDVEGVRRSALGDRTSVLPTSEQVTGVQAEAVAAELRERDDVVWASPNYVMRAAYDPPRAVRPNDPLFTSDNVRTVWDQRSHNDPGVRQILGYPNAFRNPGGFSSKAPYLWRATYGQNRVVAVLDTGITVHPDLPGWNGSTATGRILPGYDFVSDFPDEGPLNRGHDGDGWDPNPQDNGDWSAGGACYKGSEKEPSSWHGTHVAGILAAEKNNNLGTVGVAPKASILPVRVLGSCGGTTEDIAAGIRWAAGLDVQGTTANAHPADVINLSINGYAQDEGGDFHACTMETAAPYVTAIAEARHAGAVVVAAAGNEGWSLSSHPSLPATCPGVVAVGATSEYGDRAGYSNENGRKSVYSNYGSAIDISAPGGDYFWDDGGVRSTLNDGKTSPGQATYGEYIGTSMAAPVVSGGAALISSLGEFNPAQVESMLKAAVQPFPQASAPFKACTTSLCGEGIIDLNRVPVPSGAKLSGVLAVNEPLTVDPGYWVGRPASFTYQWLRDGVPISGATKTVYTVTSADIGSTLTARVTPGSTAFTELSTTTAPTAVVQAGPPLTLSGLPASTRYGATTVTATVKVAGADAGQTVELHRGATSLGAAQIDADGVATIAIRGTQWVAGSNAVRATFIGKDGINSATPPTTVSVAKASSTVTTSLPTRVKRSARATLSLTVKVTGVTGPTGSVRIYDGSRRIVTGTLSATAKGKRSIVLPKLAKGKHAIKVVYSGSPNITGKTSKVRSIVSY